MVLLKNSKHDKNLFKVKNQNQNPIHPDPKCLWSHVFLKGYFLIGRMAIQYGTFLDQVTATWSRKVTRTDNEGCMLNAHRVIQYGWDVFTMFCWVLLVLAIFVVFSKCAPHSWADCFHVKYTKLLSNLEQFGLLNWMRTFLGHEIKD